MDDVLLFAVNNEHAFIIATCVCMIAAKYHITWKLKKAQWFPRSIGFVGVDLHKAGGNTPVRSKPKNTSHILVDYPSNISKKKGISGTYINAVLKVGSSNSVYENSIKCIIFER
jgi:hypothetical protein